MIQLIKGVYLIHTAKFYLTNVPKKLSYVIIINLRLMSDKKMIVKYFLKILCALLKYTLW